MLKKLFEEANIATNLIRESMPKVVGTEYGFAFNDTLLIPKESKMERLPDFKISNLGFTIEPFRALWNDLKYYASAQRIPKSSKYHFSKLKPIAGYSSIFVNYRNYLLLLTQAMISETKGKEITSLNEFSTKCMQFFFQNGENVSLTSFVKSNLISVFSTGLAYSVMNEKASLQSTDEYITDSYFPVFQNLCLLHNFIIDPELPWVLVYRVNDEVDKENYTNAYEKEIISLLQVISEFWQLYVSNDLSEDLRNSINLNDTRIDGKDFMRQYVKIKAKEQRIHLNEKQITIIMLYMNANTLHNGLADSIKKLSNMSRIDDESLPKNWRKILAENWTTRVVNP